MNKQDAHHKQCLKDYDSLQRIAKGGSEDCGEIYETIADELLRNPSKALAIEKLKQLIRSYFFNGDAIGNPITWSREADQIFLAHGLTREDHEQEQDND